MEIMIVDDSKPFRDALSHILNKNDKYEVIAEAENGKQAVDLLDTYLPDLVLMDIEMPEMNGIEATKRMTWKYNHIKFIAITMFKEKAYLLEIIGAGFHGCIFKSNVFDELDNTIETVFKNQYHFPKDIIVKHNTAIKNNFK